MLQKLNERIQGLVAWVVIILIAITFTLFGVQSYLQTHQSTTAAAEVNGQPISKQAFQLNYQRSREARDPAGLTAAADKQLKQQLLDDLILSQVSLDSARSHGFEVSLNQADHAILQIPQFQENGQFSAERYQQALTAALFTHESFQREVRQGMLLSQQRYAFMGTAFALPSEVNKFVKLYGQTRDYRYVSIASNAFLRTVTVSPDEAHAYYEHHANAFLSPEQVSLDVIRLSMTDVRAKIQLSELERQRYYEDNKSNYLTAQSVVKPYAEVKAEVSEQLLAERAQAAYARALEDLSDWSYQTPDSLTHVAEKLNLPVEKTALFSRGGGDSLIATNRQVIQAAFSRDVLELGNNSAPIQLDNESVLVLRVHEHVPAKQKPFADVAYSIEQRVAKEKAIIAAMTLGEAMLHATSASERATLMQSNQLVWQPVAHAAREAEQVSAPINELAFSLPRAPGSTAGRALPSGDYVVVELEHVSDGERRTLDKEHLASISSQIEATDGVMDYDLYISQLLSLATIVRN